MQGHLLVESNSHETAAFVKDNLLWWWDNFGIHNYPHTSCILILCDAGGANGHRHHIFKKQMQQLAKIIGKDIIICPIELFLNFVHLFFALLRCNVFIFGSVFNYQK